MSSVVGISVLGIRPGRAVLQRMGPDGGMHFAKWYRHPVSAGQDADLITMLIQCCGLSEVTLPPWLSFDAL